MNKLIPVVIALFLLVIIADSTLYVVMETERAVKLRFGRLVETDVQPGLHIKMPLADDVRKFDSRVITLDAQPESFLTAEKKRLIVDSYVKWKIADVDTYYKATGGNESQAMNRLAKRVNDGLRNQFGTRTLHEVVSGQRDELMKAIKDDLNARVGSSLGVEVVDVRVKRIDLPSEVSGAYFAGCRLSGKKKLVNYVRRVWSRLRRFVHPPSVKKPSLKLPLLVSLSNYEVRAMRRQRQLMRLPITKILSFMLLYAV